MSDPVVTEAVAAIKAVVRIAAILEELTPSEQKRAKKLVRYILKGGKS